MLVGLFTTVVGVAADDPAAPVANGSAATFAGRPVTAVIDEYRQAGIPFAYSSGLLDDDLIIENEPTSSEPFDIVHEILEPHGLTLRTIEGVHLVIRIDRTYPQPRPADTVAGDATPAKQPAIEMIVVSASRYEISSDISSSRFQLDRRSIQTMPDVGDDPIRIAQRLPGAAASGASARTHFRGGHTDEIGIMLNGQWLFDPYHVRDYQSIFSAIDSRAISGVEVYTGGFPVRYGDRMSGLVLMQSVEQEKPRHTEIGVSVYNTSLLTSGRSEDKSWLFSARRGNLDLVIDSKFGKPTYYDVFGEFALRLTPDTTLSFNALYADDRVKVVTESDPDELEQVVSDTRNAQFWVRLDSRWSDSLTSNTVLAVTDYENLRSGTMSDPEKAFANVRDQRAIDQFSLRQEWTWNPADRHYVQWGLQATYGEARYDYSGSVQNFGLAAVYENQPQTIDRAIAVAPEGGSFAIYASDRWRLTPKTTLEWGLRWDNQSYNDLSADGQLSPRLNILHALSQETELRFTWGRYHQSQGIHELQVEDGVRNFWPAERSDHVIVGVRHLLNRNVSLRLEAFYKDLSKVRPRYENLYDPLGIIPEFQPDRILLAPESGQSRGLEISLDQTVDKWEWWASYTLATATDRINGRNESRSWDQRHAFQGGITWSDQDWSVALAGSVHSGWPVSDLELIENGIDANGEANYVAIPGPRNVLQHNTFASVDFRISRTFDVKRGSLMAFVEVSNLFNRKNVCCTDWDVTDDENSDLILESSNDYWLPLLPAVGFLWEF